MGLDLSVVEAVRWLPRPTGLARDFLFDRAFNSGCCGDGNALVFAIRAEMLAEARGFATMRRASPQERKMLLAWVRGLPWDEDESLSLHLNW